MARPLFSETPLKQSPGPDDRSTISADTVAKLTAEAKKRGLGYGVLVRRLLETIAADKMVDAILDDRKR